METSGESSAHVAASVHDVTSTIIMLLLLPSQRLLTPQADASRDGRDASCVNPVNLCEPRVQDAWLTAGIWMLDWTQPLSVVVYTWTGPTQRNIARQMHCLLYCVAHLVPVILFDSRCTEPLHSASLSSPSHAHT